MEERIICPKCMRGYLREENTYTGIIWNRKKVKTFYCPLCDFKNRHIFKINENKYQDETEV